MTERVSEQIKNIAETQHSPISADFIARVENDPKLTRDENPYTHFCVYFAAYDPNTKAVFMGHHKKSGLWLFNGGHIDEDEMPEEALEREIGEEWGLQMKATEIGAPSLLTTTDINNPTKQTCTKHYDIWYFVPVEKAQFSPDQSLLATEFHENKWLTVDEARDVITDPSTLLAVDQFEEIFTQNV